MAVVISAAMMIHAYADEAIADITLAWSVGSGPNEITIGDRWSPGTVKYYGFCIDFVTQPDYTYLYEVTIKNQVQSGIPSFTNDITDVKLSQTDKWGGTNYISSFNIQYNSSYSNNQYTYTYLIPFNTSELPLSSFKYLTVWTSTNSTQATVYEFTSANVHVIYDPNQSEFDRIMQELENIQQNQNDNNVIINQILQQQIINNENWTHIINYGSNYNQIDSNLINNLGSAEDQLSNAENALQNKSKSLVQRASGGIQQAVTASGQLVNSLTSTVPTVVSFATDIIDQTPDEVQAAVLAVPLLSFAAWLIGLKK